MAVVGEALAISVEAEIGEKPDPRAGEHRLIGPALDHQPVAPALGDERTQCVLCPLRV